MSSVYPGSLDHLATTLTSTTSMSGHAALHDLLADALNEVQLQQFQTIFNVRSYGAKGDVKKVTDGAMTSGQPTLTSATAAFTVADVGKLVGVIGAGSGTTPNLATSISAYVSATQVTLAANAASNVSGATFKYGTDDSAAITAAANAANAVGGRLVFPGGYEFWSGATAVDSNVTVEGTKGAVWGAKPGIGGNTGLIISKNPTTQTTTRVTVRTITLEGNSEYQWGGGPITNASNTCHGVKMIAAAYWVCDNVTARNWDGDGFYMGRGAVGGAFSTSDHNTVINSTATACIRNGGMVSDGSYNSWINHRFVGNQVGANPASPKYSIAMYDSAEFDMEPSQSGQLCNHTLLQNCWFIGGFTRAVQVNRSNPVIGTKILGGTIIDTPQGIQINGTQVEGFLIDGMTWRQTTPGSSVQVLRVRNGASDVAVMNCHILGGTSGASTSSAVQVDDGGIPNRPQRFKFVGNMFDATGFGTGDGHTILLSSCDSSEVWGNQLLNGATLDDRTPASTNVTVKTSLGISAAGGGVDDNGLGAVTAPGPGSGWFLSRQALTSNKAYFSRVYPLQNHVITLAAFNVTNASATDDPFEIAIYDATGATKLATTGQVTTSGKLNANGVKTQAISYTLVAGTAYYVAFAATSTATLEVASFDVLATAGLYGTGFPKLLYGDTTSAYPLPTSLTAAGSLSFVPRIILRES